MLYMAEAYFLRCYTAKFPVSCDNSGNNYGLRKQNNKNEAISNRWLHTKHETQANGLAVGNIILESISASSKHNTLFTSASFSDNYYICVLITVMTEYKIKNRIS